MNLSQSEIEDLYRKAENRKQIVEKYRRGLGAPPIDWDDANNAIYRNIDMFGFIHRNGVPPDVEEAQDQVRKKDLRREQKWLKIMPPQTLDQANSYMSSTSQAFQPSEWTRKYYRNGEPNEKLKRYIYKGIPRGLRGSVWRLLLNLPVVMKRQDGVYQKVLKRALERSPDIHQIDLDVNRTYRDHQYFYESRNPRQSMLFNVLASYSLYNTEVGYCQGMSGVAALMILFLNEEEEVFWAMSQLFTESLWGMHGFFMPSFPKLMRFCRHHENVIRQMLPKLHKHFTKYSLQTTAYAVKWFMQCFLDRLPLTLILRIWDIYLIEGDRVLVGMAYTILKHFKDKLLTMDDGDILIFLQETIAKEYIQPDEVWVNELRDNLAELRRKKLDRPPPPVENESPTRPFNPINAGCPSLDELMQMRQVRHSKPPSMSNGVINISSNRHANSKDMPPMNNRGPTSRSIETHF